MKWGVGLLAVLLGLVILALGHLMGDGGRGPEDRPFEFGQRRSDAEASGLVAATEASGGGTARGTSRAVDRGRRTPIDVIVTTVDLEGQPVPEVRVRVTAGASTKDALELVTDAEGRATTRVGVPAGRFRAKRVVKVVLAQEGFPKLSDEREVTPLHLTGDPLRLQLLAEPGRTVEGVVRDRDGQGVDSAELRLGVAPGRFELLRTDRQGGWYVHVRPNVKSLWLHARRVYTGASKLERVDLADLPHDEEVVLTLEGPATLSGRVFDSLGFRRTRLAIDVRLRAMPEELEEHELVEFERHGGLSYQMTSMGRTGTFEAKHLQRSDYRLTVDDVELEPEGDGTRWVLPVAGFHLEVVHDGRTVGRTGLVGGPGWTPEDDYEVQLARLNEHGQPGEDLYPDLLVSREGRFSIRTDEPGAYVLAVKHAQGDRAQELVTLDELGTHPTVVVKLEPGDASTLRPRLPRGATVFDRHGNASTDLRGLGFLRITDLDTGWRAELGGRWRDELPVPAGRYLVEFDTYYGPTWAGTVALEPRETKEVVLVEQVGATVELVLETYEDFSNAELLSYLTSTHGGWTRSLDLFLERQETADGEPDRFRAVFDAAPGSYTLFLGIPDGASRTKTLRLSQGQRTKVELEW